MEEMGGRRGQIEGVEKPERGRRVIVFERSKIKTQRQGTQEYRELRLSMPA
jgi:hypothetical protein